MGIYKKLQNVRSELSQLKLKKSGFNKFNNFDYFELGDFLPSVCQLCAKQGICSVVNFTSDKATLTLYDDESDQTITIETEVRKLNLISKEGKEKMNDLQALGAEQTYLRRYLYMNMFEVVENDTMDALDQNTIKSETKPKETPKPKTEVKTPTEREQLIKKMIEGYFTEEDVIHVSGATYKQPNYNKISKEQFDELVQKLKKGIENKKEEQRKQQEELQQRFLEQEEYDLPFNTEDIYGIPDEN